jgi:pimeloyl-ACP methyl ester carboxylesterase
MWRFFAPGFAHHYRTVLFDLVGSGASDLRAYDRGRYGSLNGHVDDVLQIIDECTDVDGIKSVTSSSIKVSLRVREVAVARKT